MEPTLRAVLATLLGDYEKDIDVISNSADVKPDGSWTIKYRHPTR
jgi:2-hydroxy-3-keto-5-methylthiopentenyl-1-phosphate phosphatase